MKHNKVFLSLTSAIAILAFGGIFWTMFFGLSWNTHHNTTAVKSPLIGKQAPDYNLPRLHQADQTISKQDMLGKPYLVNVWGSWCFACRDEHPVLMKYAKKLNVPLVGYNYKDKPDEAIGWLDRYGNPYTHIIVDEEGLTAFDFGVYGAPETFLIDANGVIRYKHIGAITDTTMHEEIEPKIEALIHEADS